MLKQRLEHYVDHGVSDMIKRLDNYTTARAKDLRDEEISAPIPKMCSYLLPLL